MKTSRAVVCLLCAGVLPFADAFAGGERERYGNSVGFPAFPQNHRFLENGRSFSGGPTAAPAVPPGATASGLGAAAGGNGMIMGGAPAVGGGAANVIAPAQQPVVGRNPEMPAHTGDVALPAGSLRQDAGERDAGGFRDGRDADDYHDRRLHGDVHERPGKARHGLHDKTRRTARSQPGETGTPSESTQTSTPPESRTADAGEQAKRIVAETEPRFIPFCR